MEGGLVTRFLSLPVTTTSSEHSMAGDSKKGTAYRPRKESHFNKSRSNAAGVVVQ